MTQLLFCVAVVLVAVLAGSVLAKREREEFKERFPPISDAEFLALCPRGVNPAVTLKIRRIVAHHFAIEYERVHPSMSFVEDIGAD